MPKLEKSWRRFLPNLEFHIRLPFFVVTTYMLRESHESMTIDWVRMRVDIHKWSFSFRLYYIDRTWH